MLVASEALCLMKSGFADGALARWRTLYELTVIADVIAKHDATRAARYLAHAEVQAWVTAKRWMAAPAERGAPRYSEDDLAALAERARELGETLGPGLDKMYGWALPLFQRLRL